MLLLRLVGLCAGVVQLVLMSSGDVQSKHCEGQSVHSECVVCGHLREKMCQVLTEDKCGTVSAEPRLTARMACLVREAEFDLLCW